MSFEYLIANANGSLDTNLTTIKSAFEKAKRITVKELGAKDIDVVFHRAHEKFDAGLKGVVGHTPNANLVNIFIDGKTKVKQDNLVGCLLHEIHHATRMRNNVFGKTLKEILISEGLATLFETQRAGDLPDYAKVKYSKKCAELARAEFDNPEFSYADWFTGGNKQKGIPRWFGYTYAYDLMKNYCKKSGMTPAQLVDKRLNNL
ncbi:MAG: DUF2268 domain-containing protein [Prolixibacteraceae bacterium]|nr:DUF2268 domain-containing protein [Prolixibacteraceae bacterium]